LKERGALLDVEKSVSASMRSGEGERKKLTRVFIPDRKSMSRISVKTHQLMYDDDTDISAPFF
jgi:hypothetical protein